MIQPQDFLDAAEATLNFKSPVPEAHCRSAIHLAYYAVFHMIATHMGKKTQGDDSIKHRELARLLRMSTTIDPVLYEAKRNFSRLMTLRFRADYNLAENININDANDAMDWADQIFKPKVNSVTQKKLHENNNAAA